MTPRAADDIVVPTSETPVVSPESIVLPGDADQPPVANRTVFLWAATAALAAILVWFAAITVYALRALFVQVIVAVFIAVSLDPAVRWMIRHGVRRSRAVAIIGVATLLLIAGFLYATIPTLIGEAGRLGRDFPGFLDHLRDRSPGLRHIEDRFHLQPKIDTFAREAPAMLGRQALTLGTRFFGALVNALLVIVLTIYVMADLPRLRRGIVRLFPKRHRPHVSHATNVVIDKVGSYMIGNAVISLIAGLTAFVVLLLLRVPFALPLAVVVALTDLIPLIGATLGSGICVVVAFATTDLWPNTIVLAVFFLLYQQLENYLIAPRVLRNAVDLSSLAVLLAALVGAASLGLVGALMAVPVAAAIRAVVAPMLVARDEAADQAQAEEDAAIEAAVEQAEAEAARVEPPPNASTHFVG